VTPLARWLCAALLAGAGPAAPAPAPQDPPAPEGAASEEPPAEKLEAWPELAPKERPRVELEVSKLRKARTPEMAADALAALVGNAGAMPELLAAYAAEKDEDARARLEEAMRGATDARHTRALGREFGHRHAAVRAWCLRRAAAFPDPGLRTAAEQALAGVRGAGDKGDAEELYAASLCAASSGSLAGLFVLLERAKTDWPERGAELRTALGALRGPEASAALLPGLDGDRTAVIAALRLLSAAGDETSIDPVARKLDSDDNQVRVAAINALRGIVDRQGPLEDLSVFGAIELANTWKARVWR
jgi:hypothetical protein